MGFVWVDASFFEHLTLDGPHWTKLVSLSKIILDLEDTIIKVGVETGKKKKIVPYARQGSLSYVWGLDKPST